MTASHEGSPVTPSPPEPALRPPIDRLLAPLREFSSSAAAGGILLLAAAIVALAWSNSPFHESYEALWDTLVAVGVGDASIELDLRHWVNDGLMAIFFLLVGLEIKRELLVGELASPRRAILPAAAALGGAVVPALIFLALAGGTGAGARGWGVPMATDIAFALGVLALLGRRVPLGLRIFVVALAIVDDLIAVLVIAVFYTADLSVGALGAAGGVLLVLIAINRLGVNRPGAYAFLGLLLWLAVLESGVHATVAGVLLALTIPARQRIVVPEQFVAGARDALADFERSADRSLHHRHAALWELENLTQNAQAPMLRIEHALAAWVAFLIVPVFALANAGVRIDADIATLARDPVVLGVVLGLLVGKQIGITGATWLIVRSGLASLPSGVGWAEIYGGAWVCGIGFTMSLFIADLAYETPEALTLAKVGILGASLIAGVGGYLLLRWKSSPAPEGSSAEQTGHH